MYLQNYNFLKIILHIDIYDCFFIIRKHISVLMNKKYYYQIKHLIICVDNKCESSKYVELHIDLLFFLFINTNKLFD